MDKLEFVELLKPLLDETLEIVKIVSKARKSTSRN